MLPEAFNRLRTLSYEFKELEMVFGPILSIQQMGLLTNPEFVLSMNSQEARYGGLSIKRSSHQVTSRCNFLRTGLQVCLAVGIDI